MKNLSLKTFSAFCFLMQNFRCPVHSWLILVLSFKMIMLKKKMNNKNDKI